MAKKKDIQVRTEDLFDGHIPKLMAYMKQGSVVPLSNTYYTGDPWVYFGKRNLYPEAVLELVLNTGPLQRCTQALSLMIAGNGPKFYTKKGDEIEEARDALQSLLVHSSEEEFIRSLSLDISMLNAPVIVVRRDKGGDISRLDHLDVSRTRSGQLVEGGQPDNYYWSTDWKRVKQNERYKPIEIPRYRGNEKRFDRSLIYAKDYTPGVDADEYSLPWWTGCWNAAQTWAKVDAFNATQIDTGFMAGMHLHTFTNRTDAQLKAYDERVMNAYSGARARGIWHTYGSVGEGAPVLTPIPFTSYAGQMDEIRNGAAAVIFQCYGIPGALVNELTKTGMDGASTALVQAKALVEAMLVRPKQQLITKSLVRILNDMGMAEVWEGKIDPIDFIDEGKDPVFQRQATMAAMSKNEYRVRELDLETIPRPEWDLPLNEGATKETANPPAK